MTGYSSLTFANNPLSAGVLPVLMNVADNSQNFRKASLSGAYVTMYALEIFFKQFSLVRYSVSPLSASPEFVLCTGVLGELKRTD